MASPNELDGRCTSDIEGLLVAAPWTIARVLEWTRQDFVSRGLASPRLDAELLVARALKLKRVDLYVRFEQPLSDAELAAVRALIERRRKNEPVAYILGEREFYGRKFAVDPRVLIPRPDTETLVEAALGLLPPAIDGERVRILDIGTGSGAIAITLAAERTDASVDAVDISPDAAAVARANAETLGVATRVTVHVGGLYEPIGAARYHLIASNPPYIRSADIAGLMADVRDHEPRLALDGGPESDRVLGPLLHGAREHLEAGGCIVAELGHDQATLARTLARSAGFESVEVRKDLSGIERVLIAR
jgi:release factor glutamine methyltransferase